MPRERRRLVGKWAKIFLAFAEKETPRLYMRKRAWISRSPRGRVVEPHEPHCSGARGHQQAGEVVLGPGDFSFLSTGQVWAGSCGQSPQVLGQGRAFWRQRASKFGKQLPGCPWAVVEAEGLAVGWWVTLCLRPPTLTSRSIDPMSPHVSHAGSNLSSTDAVP